MALSPFKEDRRAFPLSSPPPFRAIDGCDSFWFCARKLCLKLLNTSDLLRCETLLMVALLASLWLLCSPVCLFGHFPWRRNVQGGTASTGAFEDGRRILTHGQTQTVLPIPLLIILVASSVSVRGWHVPSDSHPEAI